MYKQRAAQFKSEYEGLQKRYNQFNTFRLILFVIALIVGFLVFNVDIGLGFVWVAISLTVFIALVLKQLNIAKQKQFAEALYQVNKEELDFGDFNFHHFKNGNEYSNPLHPYSIDLDLFGRHSIFQYFNRTSTIVGERKFADFLLKNIDYQNLIQRQEAAKEWSEKLDWRQKFQAKGKLLEEKGEELVWLDKWLNAPNIIIENKTRLTLLKILPAVFLLSIVAFVVTGNFVFPFFAMALNLYFINKTKDKVALIADHSDKADQVLKHYSELIQMIENEPSNSKLTEALKVKLQVEGTTASKQLKTLSYRIHQLNVRNGFVAGIFFNGMMLWDWFWVKRLENWRLEMKHEMPKWFEVLAEMDALMTLSAAYYNHSDWTTPELSTSNSEIIGKGLGHPLLQKEKRITNDFSIPQKGHLKLLTGSNMAGKSTFLRTIGLNIVFAVSGLPVCAESFKLPMLKVHTSMRTQDALEESTSSFYAELKRLKTIIQAVENEENIFFLLDEILKGTNSNDRHTGSRALIQQLLRHQGQGIIATHDLELGNMEAQSEGKIENLCMEVEVENEQLAFDYKIRTGVSKSFNATYLMRGMGIEV